MRKCAILFLASILMLSCGDDDSGSPPRVSDLEYSPTSAQSFSGLARVTGRFWFADPDGDLAFTRVAWKPCGLGNPIHFDMDAVGAAGVTGGYMDFWADIDTGCQPGTYQGTLTLCDEQGNWSNSVTVVFTLL